MKKQTGTYLCPICGRGTPHQHDEKTVLAYQHNALWLPMKTAPKNGETILALCQGGAINKCFWFKGQEEQGGGDDGHAIEPHWVTGDSIRDWCDEPKRWIPLPAHRVV